jgi:hypothetical protein
MEANISDVTFSIFTTSGQFSMMQLIFPVIICTFIISWYNEKWSQDNDFSVCTGLLHWQSEFQRAHQPHSELPKILAYDIKTLKKLIVVDKITFWGANNRHRSRNDAPCPVVSTIYRRWTANSIQQLNDSTRIQTPAGTIPFFCYYSHGEIWAVIW